MLLLLQLEMTRMNTRGLIKEAGGWRNFLHHPNDSYATGTDPFHLQKQDAGDTELGQLFAPEGESVFSKHRTLPRGLQKCACYMIQIHSLYSRSLRGSDASW